MARISLKAYNREIESLIDRGQIDQAIAHCRHILKFYPKHIDTYRLLGKAYLESRRYGDAADILQRVLSSVPEDFVSHVGMSIIREDEGNLDEAIWHMERAFEVQPANNAIQEELRRLYGRRDGLEPPKIRLTRGALARMYAKGDLHQQAISELRAALAEDPDRLDLQSLLANVYGRAGHRAEAAEACNSLLRKLPYCLEANRVMAEVLASSERVSETHPYLSRVQALDPYAAHLSPTTNTIQKVPEQMISLEKFDWKPGQTPGDTPSQPEWAASLGVAVEGFKSEDESLPEWLTTADEIFSTIDKEDDASQERSILEVSPESEFPWEDTSQTELTDWLPETEEEAAAPASEDEIPEWMKEAGWSQPGEAHDVEAEEINSMESLDDLDLGQPESGELAEAEIPEWLRAMAPTGAQEELEQEISEEEFPWLQEEPGEQFPSWLEESESQTKPESAGKADTWPEAVEDEKDVELPEWMLSEEALEEETGAEWLPDLTPKEEVSTAPAQDTQIEDVLPAEVEDEEEMPAWLKEALADEDVVMVAEELASDQEEETVEAEELPEWLRSLDQEESPSESDSSIEWVLEGEQLEGGSSQATNQMDKIVSEEEEAEPAEAFPDWLRDMQHAEEVPTGIETEVPEESIDHAEIEHEEPQTLDESELEEEDTFDFKDEEASFAWLESLAIKQGAVEALLMTEEERQKEAPESAKEEPVLDESTLSANLMEPEELTEEETITQDELPRDEVSTDVSEAQSDEWEPQFPEQAKVLEEKEQEPVSPETTPDWLPENEVHETGVEQTAEVEKLETSPTLSEEADFNLEDEDAAFAWLESLAVKQGADEALLMTDEERQEAVTDWQSTSQFESEEMELEETRLDKVPDEAISEETPESEAEVEPIQAGTEAELSSEEDLSEQTVSIAEPREDFLEQETDLEKEPTFLEEDTKPVRVAQEPPATAAETVPVEVHPEQPEPSQEIEEPEIFETEPEKETPPGEEVQTPAFIMAEEQKEEDADFAWLESLAIKQGADEALLMTDEERQETRPEWLPKAAEETPASEEIIKDEAISEPETLAEELVEEQVETPLDRLSQDERLPKDEKIEEPTPEMDEIEQPGVEKAEPEMPAWLQELVADEEFSGVGSATEETTVPPFTEETIEPEEVPELPGWLAEVEKEKSERETWTPPDAPIHKLNLNEASLSELEKLPDIGFILAQSIIAYRETFGPYKELDELSQVSGISSSAIDDLRRYVYIEAVQEPEPLLEEDQDVPDEIKEARSLLNNNQLDEAIETYTSLIDSNQFLNQIIQDLKNAAAHYPQEISVWQALGDAYLRSDKVQQALEAYTKAEELLR